MDSQQNTVERSRYPARSLPLPRNPRYSTLDLWRGLACLLVVLMHSAIYVEKARDALNFKDQPVASCLWFVVGHGGIGVPMFFVISGYCIAATSDSTRRKPRAILEYFKRRFRRIYPPYWIALALTIGLVLLVTALAGSSMYSDQVHPVPQPGSLDLEQWVGNLTLTEVWRGRVLGGSPSLFELGPAWTLCYEEQFYALCGLILVFSRRRFFPGVLAITFLSLGLLAAHLSIPGLFFDGNWFLFAAGVAVYYQTNYGSRWHGWILTTVFLVSAAGCLALRPLDSWQFPIFVFGPVFALLLLVLRRYDAILGRAKVLKPLEFCGRMCYSMYLIHWPLVKLISHVLYLNGVYSLWATLLITVPTATAASILAGWAFHWLVERHFLNAPSNSGVRVPVSEVSQLSNDKGNKKGEVKVRVEVGAPPLVIADSV